MAILRLLVVAIVVIVIGSFVMGYLGGSGYSLRWPTRASPPETYARPRARAAYLGSRAAVATSKVEETISEAALTTKIKAKMTLDDIVKARTINVTTHGTTVTLSGRVESKAEHDRAMSLARETDGVTEVIDDLRTR
jgi:hypothetical protein